jgi:hypothetical protein
MFDMGLLLGLMALYVCEDVKLFVSGSQGKPIELKLEPGTLLENLERMKNICVPEVLLYLYYP